MDAHRLGRGLRRRHRQFLDLLEGAAGNGHFRADDVHRLGLGLARRRFRHRRQTGRPLGRHRIGERHRLAGAAHRRVEVQLGEAGPGVGLDHHPRLGHGGLGAEALPGVGAEMVAAEDDAIEGKADAAGDGLDEVAEVGRRHAGIAAVLVDLVAGGLDQHRQAEPVGVAHGRLDDQRVRRTDRRNAFGAGARPPGGDVLQYVLGHLAYLVCAAIRASSSARVEAPSMGPDAVTARAPAALA